ncbi:MAG: dipicolinate synthase subunit DpsA [Clostridiales bacterium]|nr:dipicolinate synthase subunit DpsA [Clostridiales bacterium]
MPQGATKGGERMRFLVLGGDARSAHLYKLMLGEGLDVGLAGFSDLPESAKDLAEAVRNSDIIIGPIPFSNGQELNMPFSAASMSLAELFQSVREEAAIMGGRLNRDALRLAKERGVLALDLLEREEMAMLNAIPTAEGAIQTAMENTPFTLHQSKILVTGFGRISKVLSKMLLGLGAYVSVAARKPGDLALAEALGCQPVNIKSLEDLKAALGKADIIINTIPSVVIDAQLTRLIRKETLVIELASKPFGIDVQACRNQGANVIFAPSLPGKVAPLTAARYILLTVKNILRELECIG